MTIVVNVLSSNLCEANEHLCHCGLYWLPMQIISAMYSGMLTNTSMTTQFVAILEVHGCILVTPSAVCFCSRPTQEPESCGNLIE